MMVVLHFNDALCVDIRRRLNKRVLFAFSKNVNELWCREVSSNQILIPHALKERVLNIYKYACVNEHPEGCKLYQYVHKYSYWPALVAAWN